MTTEPDRTTALPVPALTANGEAQEHIEALRYGRLLLPQCEACGAIIWYPRSFCPQCGTNKVRWIEATGDGRVYSFTVVRKGAGAYAASVPYVVAYVELAEGPRVLTNIVGDPADIRIDAPVTAVYDRADSGEAILRFRSS